MNKHPGLQHIATSLGSCRLPHRSHLGGIKLVNFFRSLVGTFGTPRLSDMESPTKEIEEFESTALKYLQPEQIEKIWLRLRGL